MQIYITEFSYGYSKHSNSFYEYFVVMLYVSLEKCHPGFSSCTFEVRKDNNSYFITLSEDAVNTQEFHVWFPLRKNMTCIPSQFYQNTTGKVDIIVFRHNIYFYQTCLDNIAKLVQPLRCRLQHTLLLEGSFMFCIQ